MGTGDEGRGTGERGSRGAVAVGDLGGGARDAPAARSPGRPVLGRHADAERAQRRRRRAASVPPDDRGREPVGRGHGEDAARRLDRRVLRAPGMETGDSAAWLRRRRAVGSPPARSRGGGGGEPRSSGGRGRPPGGGGPPGRAWGAPPPPRGGAGARTRPGGGPRTRPGRPA